MRRKLAAIAAKYVGDVVSLTSDLIQQPSFSGREEEAASLTAAKMRELGYDEVGIDGAGNVIGRIAGSGGGRSLMFNCHLDVVSEGAHELWSHPPFGGEVSGGCVWGRGASDTKGAFAAQVYAAAAMKANGLLPMGDIYVVGVTHEEDSGLGTQRLVEHLRTDYAVIGEATSNEISYGNRGRMLFNVRIKGRSAHASVPERGANPIQYLARFISELERFELARDSMYGGSSLAPTVIQMDNKSSNVIPGSLSLLVDFRNIPSDTPDLVISRLEAMAGGCLMPGIEVSIEMVKIPVTFYTGEKTEGYSGEPAFGIDPGHEMVVGAREALEEAFGHKVNLRLWGFATDSGRLMEAGIATIGFSPADETLCHTVEDRISIDALEKGMIGNMALINRFCNLPKAHRR